MFTLRTIVSRHPTPLVLKGKSVLIVEDEPLIALQTHAILNAAGASIIAATTAAEALDLIQRADIAGAVLDIQLGIVIAGSCAAPCPVARCLFYSTPAMPTQTFCASGRTRLSSSSQLTLK